MPMPNAQPVMPVEIPLNDMEQFVDAEQPRNLWPRNQNSNFGTLRKVITSPLQDTIDTMNELLDEMFIDTSIGYLGLHEVELGLPKAVTGYSDVHRRATLYSRKARGPFTRPRLRNLVERFILDTFTSGTSTAFDASGIPITGAGITLYSGVAGPVSTLYRIYENVENFSYEVWIRSDVTPDVAGLTRELTYLTPAGITYTFSNANAVILDYFRQVRDNDPVFYCRMGFTGAAFVDNMGGGNGTLTGTAPVLASPGLLNAAVIGFANGANDFDGSTGYVSFPDSNILDFTDNFTITAIIRPDLVTAAGYTIVGKGVGSYQFRHFNGQLGLLKENVIQIGQSTAVVLTVGNTYRVAVTRIGDAIQFYVNGAPVATTLQSPGTSLVATSSPLRIGSQGGAVAELFNGVIDEVAIYNRVMSPAEILADYNTSINVA